MLDFLELADTYSEKDLESAILREIERFLLELGAGFAFVERQKRITLDGDDYYLDLLFFHRRMQRLVAVELKIGDFKPAVDTMEEDAGNGIAQVVAAVGSQCAPSLIAYEFTPVKYVVSQIGQPLAVTRVYATEFSVAIPVEFAERVVASLEQLSFLRMMHDMFEVE